MRRLTFGGGVVGLFLLSAGLLAAATPADIGNRAPVRLKVRNRSDADQQIRVFGTGQLVTLRKGKTYDLDAARPDARPHRIAWSHLGPAGKAASEAWTPIDVPTSKAAVYEIAGTLKKGYCCTRLR
jgi:hypothetical protein